MSCIVVISVVTLLSACAKAQNHKSAESKTSMATPMFSTGVATSSPSMAMIHSLPTCMVSPKNY